MKIEWNKVTWYSKLVALMLFVTLPSMGFYLGIQYQKAISPTTSSTSSTSIKTSEGSTDTATSSARKIDITDWKTFVNTAWNWEIKYLPDWKVSAVACGNIPPEKCHNVMIEGTNVLNGKCLDPNVRCGTIQIVTSDHTGQNDEHLSTPNTSAKQYVESFHFSESIEPSKEVDIAGTKGYQRTYLSSSGAVLTRGITVLKGWIVYDLAVYEGYYGDNYEIKSTKDWKLLDVFDSMIATFKFN